MEKLTKIIIIVFVVFLGITSPIWAAVPYMIILNFWSGFLMGITSDESSEEDFANIPEVKFFIEKYPNYTTNHSSDFLGWKIINYDGDVGQNDVHLSVKKSVLHQGVKISAGCEVGVSSGYALNILDDKVMDYLKNDTCEKKTLKIQVCRGECTDVIILEDALIEGNEKLDPEVITVVLGKNNTVRWINHDYVAHGLVSDTGGDDSWSTGLLKPGESFSVTFDHTGVFPYHGAPHPWITGAVIVFPSDDDFLHDVPTSLDNTQIISEEFCMDIYQQSFDNSLHLYEYRKNFVAWLTQCSENGYLQDPDVSFYLDSHYSILGMTCEEYAGISPRFTSDLQRYAGDIKYDECNPDENWFEYKYGNVIEENE